MAAPSVAARRAGKQPSVRPAPLALRGPLETGAVQRRERLHNAIRWGEGQSLGVRVVGPACARSGKCSLGATDRQKNRHESKKRSQDHQNGKIRHRIRPLLELGGTPPRLNTLPVLRSHRHKSPLQGRPSKIVSPWNLLQRSQSELAVLLPSGFMPSGCPCALIVHALFQSVATC